MKTPLLHQASVDVRTQGHVRTPGHHGVLFLDELTEFPRDPPRPHAAASKGGRWRQDEIAEYLGVTRQRVQQLAAAGRLPAPAGEGPHWQVLAERHPALRPMRGHKNAAGEE
jgi:excisionase family DNA binding protein